MIEVNLLPGEFRPRDKTPVPLLVTLFVGIAAIIVTGFYYMQVQSEVASLKSLNADLQTERDEAKKVADEVDRLEQEIDRQKTRQQTIIEISQSKIMWSLKLVQFANIMREFPEFWIENIRLTRGRGSNTGELTMSVNAVGSDLREVARFRDALKHDPNFRYHFGPLVSQTVTFNELDDVSSASQQMSFTVQLPIQTSGGGGRGRR